MSILTDGKKILFVEHQDKKMAGTFQSTFQNTWRPLINTISKRLAEGRYQLVGSAEISLLGGGRGDEAQIRLKIDGAVAQNTQNAHNIWQTFGMAEFFDAEDGEQPDILIEYRLRGNGGDTAQARRIQIGWSNVGPKKVVE